MTDSRTCIHVCASKRPNLPRIGLHHTRINMNASLCVCVYVSGQFPTPTGGWAELIYVYAENYRLRLHEINKDASGYQTCAEMVSYILLHITCAVIKVISVVFDTFAGPSDKGKMLDITRDKPIKVAVRVVVPVRDHPKVILISCCGRDPRYFGDLMSD